MIKICIKLIHKFGLITFLYLSQWDVKQIWHKFGTLDGFKSDFNGASGFRCDIGTKIGFNNIKLKTGK